MALFWYIDILDSIWIVIVIILIIIIKMMSFRTGYASRRLLNILLGPTLYFSNFGRLFKIFFSMFWYFGQLIFAKLGKIENWYARIAFGGSMLSELIQVSVDSIFYAVFNSFLWNPMLFIHHVQHILWMTKYT